MADSLGDRLKAMAGINKEKEIELKNIEDALKLQEASLANEMKKAEIMKQGGIHWATRREHAKAMVEMQDELYAAQQEQAKLADEINAKATKRANIQKGFMASLQAINDLVNMGIEAFEYQNNLTEGTANNLGIGVTEAMKMNKEFAAIAANGNQGFVTADVIENYKALRDEIGDTSIATAEVAGSMTNVVKSLKIGTAEAAMFYKQVMLTDGLTAQAAENTLILGKNLADASGVNFQNVMADVAKSGKQFQNYFGKSTKDMLKAAVAARKMGLELSDMVEMSQGLLDVEGRIEKQMKFNMLTGKNINMDKATSLMLAGKEEDAMKEIVAQVGDTSELGILERQALDELLGGKLVEMEQAQQKAEMTTIEAEKTTQALTDMDSGIVKAETRKQMEADIATEMTKQNNYLTNQKDLLAANTAETVNQTGAAKGLVAIQQALAIIQMAVAVAGIFSAFAQIPFGIGIPLAIAAVVGLGAMVATQVNAVESITDGMIDPQGGLVVSGQKGSIQLDPEDSIVAGTDLGGKNKPNSNGMNTQPAIDLAPLLEKLDQVIAAVSKGRTVSVDGYQLNEAIHLEKIPSGVA